MKFVKRFFIFLVLCFAVIGVISFFKPAPDLNISEDDKLYLEKELGKSSSTEASKEGLSGVLMNVEGAPSLDAVSYGEALDNFSTPPAAFAAPTFSPNSMADAPAFVANEALPFTPAEAPAFVPASPAAPIASPFTPIQLPAPSGINEEATQPIPPQIPLSSVSPYNPFERPPLPDASPPPLAWNGPATEVINLPSSVQTGLQGDFVITGPSVSAIEPSFVSTDIVTDTVTEAVWRDEKSPRNGLPQVASVPVKRLPTVSEEPVVDVAESVSVPLFTSAETESSAPSSTEDQYRQTSVRSDISFVNVPATTNEPLPIISFGQSLPGTASTTFPQESLVALSSPTASSPVLEGATEVIPFVAAGDNIAGDNATWSNTMRSDIATSSASSPAVSTVDLSTMLRPTVTRFVKAQGVLAESGDPLKMRGAFIQLSKLYELPELNDAERAHMRPVLDRLALAIIYSRHIHVLEPAYIVRAGDTVESVASSVFISPALLRKINGLSPTQSLAPGATLKIVVGKFDAKISASRRELTLILGGLYAGCFPVHLGERAEAIRGEAYVTSVLKHPQQPALTLNNGVLLQGLQQGMDSPDGTGPQAMTVRLAETDATELFDILAEQSIIVFED